MLIKNKTDRNKSKLKKIGKKRKARFVYGREKGRNVLLSFSILEKIEIWRS